jgi:hypothetical protein
VNFLSGRVGCCFGGPKASLGAQQSFALQGGLIFDKSMNILVLSVYFIMFHQKNLVPYPDPDAIIFQTLPTRGASEERRHFLNLFTLCY